MRFFVIANKSKASRSHSISIFWKKNVSNFAMLLKYFFKLINRGLIREIINLYRKPRERESEREMRVKG